MISEQRADSGMGISEWLPVSPIRQMAIVASKKLSAQCHFPLVNKGFSGVR